MHEGLGKRALSKINLLALFGPHNCDLIDGMRASKKISSLL